MARPTPPSSLTGSDVLDEIVAVIGWDAMAALAKAYGGTRIDVRVSYEPESAMVAAIGAKAAAQLADSFHGSRLSIPIRLARALRVKALAQRIPRLTRPAIALEVGITERTVDYILADKAEDNRQMGLFDKVTPSKLDRAA